MRSLAVVAVATATKLPECQLVIPAALVGVTLKGGQESPLRLGSDLLRDAYEGKHAHTKGPRASLNVIRSLVNCR